MKIRMDYVLLLFIISSHTRKIKKKRKKKKNLENIFFQDYHNIKIAVQSIIISTACLLSKFLLLLRKNGQK